MEPQANGSVIDRIMAWLRSLFGGAKDSAGSGMDRVGTGGAGQVGTVTSAARDTADAAATAGTSVVTDAAAQAESASASATAAAADSAASATTAAEAATGSVVDRARTAATYLERQAADLARPYEDDNAGRAAPDDVEVVANAGDAGDVDVVNETVTDEADVAVAQAEAAMGSTGASADEVVTDATADVGDVVLAATSGAADLAADAATAGDAGDESLGPTDEVAERPLESLGLFGASDSGTPTDLSYLDQQDTAWFSFDTSPSASDTVDEGEQQAGESPEADAPEADAMASLESESDVTTDVETSWAVGDLAGDQDDVLEPASDEAADDALPSDVTEDVATSWEVGALSVDSHSGDADGSGDDEDPELPSDVTEDAETSWAVGDLSDDQPETASTDAAAPVAAASGGNQPGPNAGQVRGNADGSCPVEFPIKGNGSSKIYHVPGIASFAATRAEWCFATEADAVAAGYRAPSGHRGVKQTGG